MYNLYVIFFIELGTVFEGDKSNCFGGVYKDNACFCEGQTGFNTENLRSCKKLANHKTKGCTAQESCYLFGPQSFCDSSKLCACKAGYSMNSDNWCVQLFCSTNEDCAGIEHSFCDQKNGCTCEENYFMVDGKCQTSKCYIIIYIITVKIRSKYLFSVGCSLRNK